MQVVTAYIAVTVVAKEENSIDAAVAPVATVIHPTRLTRGNLSEQYLVTSRSYHNRTTTHRQISMQQQNHGGAVRVVEVALAVAVAVAAELNPQYRVQSTGCRVYSTVHED